MYKNGYDFLNSLNQEYRELLRLRDASMVKRLSPLPPSLAPKPGKVQAAMQTDPMGDALAEAIDLDDVIRPKIAALREHRRQALDLIYQLPDARHRSILICRYIKVKEHGKRPSWLDIAADMEYDYRHTTKLHHAAMEAFEKVYELHPPA